MSNNCQACQEAFEKYRAEHPTPTGGGSFNYLDALCESHKQEALQSGKFNPITVPVPDPTINTNEMLT